MSASAAATAAVLDSQCDVASFQSSDIRTLLLLVDSPEPTVALQALENLSRYAEINQKNRQQLLNFKIVDILLRLIHHSNVEIKKSSVVLLAASTEVMDIHGDMKRKDLLEELVKLLAESESPEVNDEAAFAISNCARDFANKAQIRKVGGLKALVALLESSDPDVKKNAALAISLVLEDFTNRTEIRYLNGLPSLLDLLNSDFLEIKQNALMSIIRCSEDFVNRVEFGKLRAVPRLVELLAPETPELHQLSLQAISNFLEEPGDFALTAGLPTVAKFLISEDTKCRQFAAVALAKTCKNTKNWTPVRETGVVPILVQNLNHGDPGVISSSASALVNLAKSEINQIEIARLGGIDILIRLLTLDNIEVARQGCAVLASMCLNQKVRSRVKNSLSTITSLLTLEDLHLNINTCECLTNLAEDTEIRGEIAKSINLLMNCAKKSDLKLQCVSVLAVARCMNDAEARVLFSQQNSNITRLVELLGSKDINVCRNAALALGNACEYEPNAVSACQSGTLEAMIALISDTKRNSCKFATDALENLLNHYLPAKYWISNKLIKDNIITDGFYDFGAIGANLSNIKPFPSLETLKTNPVDKKRECILIDSSQDPVFIELVQKCTDGISQRTPIEQISYVASIVVDALGGAVEDATKISDIGFKFKITQLKLQLGENVIPIGMLSSGTFYHRALLFKSLCDRIGLGPVNLIRGEYNRAWNEILVNKLAILAPPIPKDQQLQGINAGKSKPGSGRGAPATTATTVAAIAAATGGNNAASKKNAPSSAGNSKSPAVPVESFPMNYVIQPGGVEVGIVDLMFKPGDILPIGSNDAKEYMRSWG